MPTQVMGYDPGGNGRHGVALLAVKGGSAIREPKCKTLGTVEDVIRWVEREGAPEALGVDTLTAWSTGASGWRPADRYLRSTYPAVANRILSPNTLRGGMVANGMSVVHLLRAKSKGVIVSETHPKVLYYAVTGETHDYKQAHNRMDEVLSELLGLEIKTENEDEWDALLSAFAVLQGIEGRWTLDLHHLPPAGHEGKERLVYPAGPTSYYWPNSQHRRSAPTPRAVLAPART